MKKLLLGIACAAFASTPAYAAAGMAMDCRKDCCKDKAEHQHEAPAAKK